MKVIGRKITVTIIFIIFVSTGRLFSQPPPPPAGGGAPCYPPPCGIPLDGGISFLIAAGVAYGGKKVYDFRKKGL